MNETSALLIIGFCSVEEKPLLLDQLYDTDVPLPEPLPVKFMFTPAHLGELLLAVATSCVCTS